MRVSYLEIYNETIRDLLTSEERTLDLREDGRLGMVIAGLQEVEVSSTVEILNLLRVTTIYMINNTRLAIEIEPKNLLEQMRIQLGPMQYCRL